MRVLAVTTPTRSPVNMSWPTLKEAGVPEVATSIWTGLFAPKGVPQPILDRLYSEATGGSLLEQLKNLPGFTRQTSR